MEGWVERDWFAGKQIEGGSTGCLRLQLSTLVNHLCGGCSSKRWSHPTFLVTDDANMGISLSKANNGSNPVCTLVYVSPESLLQPLIPPSTILNLWFFAYWSTCCCLCRNTKFRRCCVHIWQHLEVKPIEELLPRNSQVIMSCTSSSNIRLWYLAL